MQNTTQVLDRAEVERIAYRAIGHQFRLPSLFSMLLLIVGFVLGHYVAARHTGELADRFEQRMTALQEKIAALESGSAVLQGTVTSSAAATTETRLIVSDSETSPFDSENSTFRLAGMARTFDSPATDFAVMSVLGDADPTGTASRDAVESLRHEATGERDACLAELAPYAEKRLSVAAATVVHVVESIYKEQDRRLASAMNDAAAKATGIDPRDTSIKIFPPMADEAGAVEKAPADEAPLSYRFFPKPSAPKSMFFAPTANRVPPPATSALEPDTIVR